MRSKLNPSVSTGVTPSERYLSRLCRRSFLSLWSYSNLHTDEGRKNAKGVGHELCDLLVVFGNDVIIFSDKYIKFDQTIDTNVAWTRWFKKAVQRSAIQLYGAESWLRRYPDRVYLDPSCLQPIPISLPSPDKIRVHRVAVALGVYGACRDFFGGNSLGSLIIHSGLDGDDHFSHPFNVGHVNRQKGFVHVFEDFTLDAVLTELDTVSDFIAYLSNREKFLSKEKPIVIAAGDEQLLAIYLTHLNTDNEHDFVVPDEGQDGVYLDESFWDGMVQNPQYLAKKQADRISYVWDRLIEHFIRYAGTYDDSGNRTVAILDLEWSLRKMASEPRIRRRQLGHALVDLLESTPLNKRAARLVCSNDFPENAYIFLILPIPSDKNYEEYREYRKALLGAYCKVAKLQCPNASYIIGVATESRGASGASEDLVALDVREWTHEMQTEAERLQKDASILRDENIKKTEGRTSEWPETNGDGGIKT